MGNKKGKFKSGTWIEREMYMSRAFLSLSGFAPQFVILVYGKRDFNKNRECTNSNNITMTYPELENIFNVGNRNPLNKKKDGISKPRITRAINEALKKGFIEIVHQGGAFKQDKTIFALSDNWRIWQPGVVFSERKKDTRTRGYRKPKKKIKVTHENVPIHTDENVPIRKRN